MGLSTLPYDLLLNIATYLDLRDVHALHSTSRALYEASTTRTVYRKLANDLLRRCRALPLKGFQRLSDLTTEQLIRAVNKATHYEAAWRVRAPQPIASEAHTNGINSHSNYMDVSPKSRLSEKVQREGHKWYKIVSAPPGEEVDWLSPITSSYTLCATKSGKVVCWDVQSDTCLAEWNPGARWELWKCRVEFEERTVFFTMAKVLSGSYDDDRVMEFVLMRLTFSDGPSGESSPNPPIFSHVTEFRTTGVVMNVFLLDPSERLLSAFIWVSTSNTIGLYALPDWDKNEYVFVDTGIECVMSSNWSCILYQQHIVIHCEESDAAYQHFYPLSLLRTYTNTLPTKDSTPSISRRLPPARTLKKKFIFPLFVETDSDADEPDLEGDIHTTINESYLEDTFITTSIPILNGDMLNSAGPSTQPTTAVPSSSPSQASTTSSSSSSLVITAPPHDNPNPYPFPPWYPESAHFVRQWWPSLANIPRVSCTVVLLAAHDPETHRTRFVLAQHYFRVPLDHAEWEHSITAVQGEVPVTNGKLLNGHVNGKRPATLEDVQDDALMHLWYVSTPFEVVRVFDGQEEEDDGQLAERPRPLVAVDFGHAVWIEYDDEDRPRAETDGESEGGESKSLRFVTFPPFSEEYGVEIDQSSGGTTGEVRKLEIPPELDLSTVETINIDQSQGAIILSDKTGRIFILCYE
ncbi:hypothetical protein NLJ89_g3561 [Agrocybe chaxingu]|uniref:F-box domain-containing protein n=1 Tax=Agrocybe chaxingu TaxID=84603 RepID=A0A9W8MYF8_9AGAR|nr:hypothetical protein NLJ89_g3561 [Agrocybe chaxingu]